MQINKSKITLTIAILMVSSVIFAKSKSDKLFETFRSKPGVTYFAFTKNIQDAFNINLDEEGKNISGNLHEIRFMSYNPLKGNINGSEFMNKATGMLPSAYAEIVEKDDKNDTQIRMLGNKRKASEFHVFVQNDDPDENQFLISFFGDFNIDDMGGIREISLSLSSGK